jgi:hypothetical protein
LSFFRYSSISIYLAYNLYEDIDKISRIYQNSIAYSLLKEDHDITNGIQLSDSVLLPNIIFSSSILILLYALFSLYISSKVIDKNEIFHLLKIFLENVFITILLKCIHMEIKQIKYECSMDEFY